MAQTTNVHENRLINLAAADMDGSGWKQLVKSKITPDQLQSDECAEIFRYAIKRHEKDGRYPSKKILRQIYPTFHWAKVNESFSLVIDTFKEWRKAQLVYGLLEDGVKTFQIDGHEDALAHIQSKILEIQAENVVETGDVVTDDEDYFWDLMDRRADTSGDLIPLGFPTIDAALNGGGLRPGHLLIIIARDKVGKSTLSMQIAINAHDAGRKVVYQTYEMDTDETLERFMAQKTKVSPNRMSTGSLKKSEEQRVDDYFDQYDTDPDLQGMLITMNIRDLAAVEAYADEHRPDVMVIDGAYFMDLAEQDTRTQEIETMLRGLLQIGQRYNCLMILTTQALESKMNGHRLKSTSGAHSSAWQQYAHLMLGLERVPLDGTHDTEENSRKLRILANRIGKMDVEVDLVWDWGSLLFEEA